MLEINHLTKQFRKYKALDNLSVGFGEGVYGLLGPNGAGKTTLMRCVTGLYPIPGKTILCNGKSIQKNPDYLRRIGYLPQKFGLFREMTVYDALQLLGNLKGLDQRRLPGEIQRVLAIVHLEDRSRSRVSALSGGMLRRVGIAQALLGDPDIIIFDEPTAGLDPEERLRFKNVIASIKQGKTIIISTHIVEDVEAVCDRIVVVSKGHVIAQGSSGEIQALAQGKVFLLPENQRSQIVGSYLLQRQYEENGLRMMKILSTAPQYFYPAAPAVEDGYICAIENI